MFTQSIINVIIDKGKIKLALLNNYGQLNSCDGVEYMKNIHVEKTILQNGLRVVTLTRESGVFSLGVGIRTGSLYENRENNGISHMVEHMLFKGTSGRTMDRLNDEIEKLAGDLDIYTTYNETVLTVSVIKNKAGDCLDIVSDMLMNASFPEKELGMEKRVIIEEIKMAKDDPEDMAYLGLYKAAFPETWHRYHIAGTVSSVKSIKKEKLEEFYRSYYTPEGTCICVVSSYTHQEVVDMVSHYFGPWKSAGARLSEPVREAMHIKKVTSRKKGIGQAHVLYGFDIHDMSRREEVALALLNKKIGSGPNSVLFKELRDKRGYTYTVYSDMDLVKGIKMFYIYSGLSMENLKDTIRVIDNVVSGFREGKLWVDEEGIGLIKDIFMTSVAVAMETPSHMVDYLLDGELNYGNPLEYQNILSIMKDITPDDVKYVAQKILNDPVIYILSPD